MVALEEGEPMDSVVAKDGGARREVGSVELKTTVNVGRANDRQVVAVGGTNIVGSEHRLADTSVKGRNGNGGRVADIACLPMA